MLAGETSARHPIHGDELKVRFTDGKLVLAGEVPSKRDRDELVREARARIGNGLTEYDAGALKIRPRGERGGILSQTLLAAFEHRDVAELGLKFLLEHARSKPLRAQVIDRQADLNRVLPAELIEEAKKQLERGRTLVMVDVDETEAFRARSLLEEDTRSRWTIAAPPRVMSKGTK